MLVWGRSAQRQRERLGFGRRDEQRVDAAHAPGAQDDRPGTPTASAKPAHASAPRLKDRTAGGWTARPLRSEATPFRTAEQPARGPVTTCAPPAASLGA